MAVKLQIEGGWPSLSCSLSSGDVVRIESKDGSARAYSVSGETVSRVPDRITNTRPREAALEAVLEEIFHLTFDKAGMPPENARQLIRERALKELQRLGQEFDAAPAPEGLGEASKTIADRICLRVAELPDRTSPDDWPEACLVESEELHAIVLEEIASLAAHGDGG